MIANEKELPDQLPDGHLHIFVLGPGLGESIVLRTPLGRWFVIDCYAKVGGFILPKVVLERYSVDKLEGLVLTHPDLDHYKGMAELSEEYPANKVAASASMLDPEIAERVLTDDDIPNDTRRTAARKGAAAVYARFSQMDRDGIAQCIPLIQGEQVHSEPSESFEIMCHTPTNRTASEFATSGATANQMSAVLEILWGGRSWLLTADLPSAQWDALAYDFSNHNAAKIPHHGSLGSISNFWCKPASGVRRYWVATPFNRGRNAPPQPEALQRLLSIEPSLHLTSLPARYEYLLEDRIVHTDLSPRSPGPPPRDHNPPEECVVYLCFSKDGSLANGCRLPGSKEILSS